jgi:hypothetical protein
MQQPQAPTASTVSWNPGIPCAAAAAAAVAAEAAAAAAAVAAAAAEAAAAAAASRRGMLWHDATDIIGEQDGGRLHLWQALQLTIVLSHHLTISRPYNLTISYDLTTLLRLWQALQRSPPPRPDELPVSQHELERAARYSPHCSPITRRLGAAGNWAEARESLIEESRRVLQELTHPNRNRNRNLNPNPTPTPTPTPTPNPNLNPNPNPNPDPNPNQEERTVDSELFQHLVRFMEVSLRR